MLARRSGARPDARGEVVVPVPMSRAEIADYLGLTTETVSRALSRLQDERVVRLRGKGEILVPDRQALEAIAAG
jgi:CRP-like cAMP-binding protein